MDSKWSDSDAQTHIERYRGRCNLDLALRVYSSRLIGSDASLVLHGGGNTSVKTVVKDDLGRDVEVLCVKGSGWDLGDIEPQGFPAVRLDALKALRHLDTLSDEDMVNAQRTRMLDASAPNPSVETLLHAFLPHKYIDHSHADVILSLVDQPDAEALCRKRFGSRFGIVRYIMPGFALAKLAAEIYERDPNVEGLLLLQHGLFTFGQSARESYERHVRAVDEAEQLCMQRRYWSVHRASVPPPAPALGYDQLAPVLRGVLGDQGRRYVLCRRDSAEIADFLADPKLEALSQNGCATPDHVIRTKRFPLVLRVPADSTADELRVLVDQCVQQYRAEYAAYVQRQMTGKGIVVKPLDPDPRVLLIPGVGLVTAAATPEAASIAADIYEHTIRVIRYAEAIGSYRALPEGDIFDMEYWSLEQAKLGKSKPKPLATRIVYITGAARGIGAATARAFAAEGAVLYLVDREADALTALARELRCACEVVDLTDEAAVRRSVEHAVERYGGLDGVISNAGTAPQGAIDRASTRELAASFAINFYAHHWVASAASAVLEAQASGGFLLFNASKAAWNPGPGFGPYAVAKAALLALVKQYALELGEIGIRCNAVNADRIRTGLLDAADIEARAQARGLSPDDYYRSNLLRREVSADDVARAFVSLALAESTTGSVLTVDGGNIAASPR
jgi:rhamnose utilization protein RhaD (predicted bifunctional aldolase and dehydrogenase)/NAD(P)-dependent dehydrogenase (short-subunit alcohol dehydrogenase family)